VRSWIVIAGILSYLAWPAAHATPGPYSKLERRAEVFNAQLFPGIQADELLDRASPRRIPGIRNLKTVIPGALYRAGGLGGSRPLSAEALSALCREGFSQVVYLYPEGFRPTAPVECRLADGRPNRLVYKQLGFQFPADKRQVLGIVHDVLNQPEAGPVLVHCWNGWHASGEIAANALVQFCSQYWSPAESSAYWNRNQTGLPLVRRVAKFRAFEDLRIAPAMENAVCLRPDAP
jgi:hypothetical protein